MIEHDFADDLRGPDPTDRLFYKVMITLGVILGILIAGSWIGFAWAGA